MQTILRLPGVDQSYRIRGLTLKQSSWVKGFAGTDKMKLVIGTIVQGTVDPKMTVEEAGRFCNDHAPEAAQLATEIIKLTVN